MSIKVSLNHKTHYHFDRDVNLSPHIIRLKPAPHTRIPIEAYSLKVTPENYFINWQQDPFGNYVARLVFNETAKHLFIEVDLIAQLTTINPFDFFVDEYAKYYPFEYSDTLKEELSIYTKKGLLGPLFQKWLAKISSESLLTIDYLSFLNQQIHKTIRYVIRLEHGVQTCEETLKLGTGSCRDMAWLLLQTLRYKGIAARFVSGYLVQLKTGGYLSQDNDTLSHDLTDLHAWVEAYIPGAGWIGLDPTSGLFASEGHIPLCCTPEPSSAAPIVGSTDVCDVRFEFNMSVSRLDPTSLIHADPYNPETWQAIDEVGKEVDKKLKAQHIHLTLGGEPTFVAMDNQDAPEWNVQALGDHKLSLASDLIKRLMQRTMPGGFIIHGQGKWYGGEELPRWMLGCYWRKDLTPLWKDPSLFADIPPKQSFDLSMAEKFIHLIAEKLSVSTENILPAFEDEYLQQLLETPDLPTNTHPINPPIGYVLPVTCTSLKTPFQSFPWSFKRRHLFLVQGTSPLGYRLPLKHVEMHEEKKRKRRSEPLLLRTALCVELRRGTLYIFIPPIPYFDVYTTLIKHIEATAAQLGCQLILEGYPPPEDTRITHFQVTPDPGVIEVNVCPSGNWEELKEHIISLYEEAKNARLTTEKYLIDGRRVGGGGGHHIIIGGPVPPQSPILQRPDLLQSFLTYWQHHPCFSYFFSGLFVGPTSQAPRIDEARYEALDELEIAFSQLPSIGKNQFHLIDRLFRNLLVDITGNTHRSEISIDKLYDLNTAHGKQGLLEFRSFEMQPHPHMSLLQLLLIRALVAYFWKTPYQHRLIRWGRKLQDKMMLPYFLWADLCDVILELNQAGFKFQKEWFEPFYEFRFPIYGRAEFENIHLELRMALEPWNVLGEENHNNQSARTVDSSTERLQIKIKGIVRERHIVTCNKRSVPLHPSTIHGEYIGGIKFKAWNPPQTLHPLIPVHAPLTFDIYDTWLKRSIGGVTYHVAHPGGLSYAKLPINSKEAEARRNSRFEIFGHTPGKHIPFFECHNEENPFTLDLRKSPGSPN